VRTVYWSGPGTLMARTLLTFLTLALVSLPLGTTARALVIEDGSPNDTRPSDDPGWDNAGYIEGNLNAVYLGHGWAATANHVGLGSQIANFAGSSYPIVPGSAVRIEHDATHDADLKVFRMFPYPRLLPVLEIASSVSSGEEVMLIARGRTNGGAIGDPPTAYTWGGSGISRWGTNHLGALFGGNPILSANVDFGSDRTRSLFTQFDAAGSAYETSIATGDSGGALFVKKGSDWELAGIAWAIIPAVSGITTYGDDGLSADLTYATYRSQVLAIARPCDDGVDNDGDQLADANDPDCLGAGDLSEEPACSDGLDNDADGNVDMADADCGASGDLLEAPDGDGDLFADYDDNCSEVANASQTDTNLDGYGNACDPDYNNDGGVGGPDFALLAGAYGSFEGQPKFDPDIDMNGDGAIGFNEYLLLGSMFGKAPGPSGLVCAGVPPCF
jgi:hypothetical protein